MGTMGTMGTMVKTRPVIERDENMALLMKSVPPLLRVGTIGTFREEIHQTFPSQRAVERLTMLREQAQSGSAHKRSHRSHRPRGCKPPHKSTHRNAAPRSR